MEAWVENILSEKKRDGVREPAGLAALTLVIPSYGRQDFLLRQAAYWGFSAATVVMLDGSPEPFGSNAQAILGQAPNLLYCHAPVSITDRLRLAAGYIRTPYAALLGDDEFYLKIGLGRAIDRLNEDASLVGCNGQSLMFNSIFGYAELDFYPGYAHWRFEILEDSARDRLLASMREYNAATSYAVLRTPVWIRGWGSKENWSSPYVFEIFQFLMTFIYGKFCTVDDLLLLRSLENESISSRDNCDRRLRFYDWWNRPDYAAERERFLGELAGELMAKESLDPESGQSIVREAIEAYLEYCERREQQAASASPAAALRAGLSKWARQALGRETFLRLKRAAYAAAGKGGGGYSGDPGLATPDAETMRELDGIRRLVAEFHEIRRERVCVQ